MVSSSRNTTVGTRGRAASTTRTGSRARSVSKTRAPVATKRAPSNTRSKAPAMPNAPARKAPLTKMPTKKKPAATTASDSSDEEAKKPEDAPAPAVAQPPAIQTFGLKTFNTTVMADSTACFKEADKWPFVIDETEKVAVFLGFQNAKEIDVAKHKEAMDPEFIRLAILNALRYGCPLVLHVHDIADFAFVSQMFDAVRPNMLQEILTKEIQKPEKFLSLRREGVDDFEEYGEFKFMARDFKFLVVASAGFPVVNQNNQVNEWCTKMLPVRINNPSQ